MTDFPRLIEHAFPLKQASLDSVHEYLDQHALRRNELFKRVVQLRDDLLSGDLPLRLPRGPDDQAQGRPDWA
jgi:hypothetical protein